ncbi:MAG: hypothetical protein SVR08_18360 [Spirochaetota bacterium]|nr:hypothetical protein [Spirochaetota bacterium]
MYIQILSIFFALLLVFPSYIMAQEDEESKSSITLGGYVKTDNRMRIEDDNELSFHEYRLDLKTEANPGENLHIFSDLWIRSIRSTDSSNVTTSSDLSDKDKVSPWNIDLREAYVDVYGFILEDIDLRLGRQRITWGTGDKLNPTDNLNPDDLEDLWDFGRHLGSDSMKITYYLADLTLTGVYIPIFNPAVMPLSSDWAAALASPMEMPAGISIGSIRDTVNMPENNLQDGSTTGIKAGIKIINFDISLSYVYGRDDIPLMNKATLTPTSTPGVVDIVTEFIYPRLHVAGIDMAGSIFDIGVWAEAATFFPERMIMVTDMTALGYPVNNEELVLDDERPYTKYVVGADYTFKNGIYINSQYLHGFVHERGRDGLGDYIMFGLEYKMLNDKIKIIPIQGGIEITDFDDVKNNYAIIYSPEISYYPYDNIELIIGAYIIDGKDTTTFGRVKDLDELFFKVKGSF